MRRATRSCAQTGGQQPRGHLVRVRRGGGVLERPGVGDQAGVDGGGDLGVELDAEPVDAARARAPRWPGAVTSTRWMRPKPVYDAWWSTATKVSAACAAALQHAEPVDRADVEGHHDGHARRQRRRATSRCWPGRVRSTRGTANGSSPKETATSTPSRSSARPTASAEPSASASGRDVRQQQHGRAAGRARPSARPCSSRRSSRRCGPGHAVSSSTLVLGRPVVGVEVVLVVVGRAGLLVRVGLAGVRGARRPAGAPRRRQRRPCAAGPRWRRRSRARRRRRRRASG